MGPGHPPPTWSRLEPLRADSGGPRSIGCSCRTSSREPGLAHSGARSTCRGAHREGARVFCRPVWSQARIAQRPTGNHLALPRSAQRRLHVPPCGRFAFLGSSWRLRQEGRSLSRLYHALQLVERPDRAPAAWPGAPWILPIAGGGFSGLVLDLRHAPMAVVAQSRPGPSLVGGGGVVHWQKPSLSRSPVSRL